MDLLGVTALSSFLERLNWGVVVISDLTPSNHRFLLLRLDATPQKFLHTLRLRKSAFNRAPHLLRPALGGMFEYVYLLRTSTVPPALVQLLMTYFWQYMNICTFAWRYITLNSSFC